jgi:hypothetical protein
LVQAEQHRSVKTDPDNDDSYVVDGASGCGIAKGPKRSAPLDRDAIVNGKRQKRAEQQKASKITVGNEMRESLDLDRREHRVPDGGSDA